MNTELSSPRTSQSEAGDKTQATSLVTDNKPLNLNTTTNSTPSLRNSYDDVNNDEVEDTGNDNDRSMASREALWGSPCMPKNTMSVFRGSFTQDDCSVDDVRVERRTMQLNRRNLSQMEKDIAAGKVDLHPEVLFSDPFCLKNVNNREKSLSVLSVAAGTEDGTAEPATKYSFGSAVIPEKRNQMRDSLRVSSFCSVESVCGSAIASGTLSRKNLEQFSRQLREGVTEVTPEVLLDNNMTAFNRSSRDLTTSGRTSLQVELGSEAKDDARSQYDIPRPFDATHRFSQNETPSELSCNRASMEENLQFRRGGGGVKGERALFRQKLLSDYMTTDSSYAMLPDRKASESMQVNPPLSPCRLEECEMPRDETMSTVSSKVARPSDYGQKENNVELICELRQLAEKASQDIRDLKLEQAKVVADMTILQHTMGSYIADVATQLTYTEKKSLEFQTMLDENKKKMEAYILQSSERIPSLLSNELNAFRNKLEEDMAMFKVEHEKERVTLLNHVNDQIQHVKQLVSNILTLPDTLKLKQPCREEMSQIDKTSFFPPYSRTATAAEVIPEGEKIRLAVDIQYSAEPCEVLLPISCKATVGMCKRELMRRLHQQGLVDNTVSYSNVFLLQKNMTLYEEDVLEDILVPTSQGKNDADKSSKLILRRVPQKSIHNSTEKKVGMKAEMLNSIAQHSISSSTEVSARSNTADVNDAAGSSLMASKETSRQQQKDEQELGSKKEVTSSTMCLQTEDNSHLRPSHVEQLNQNESIYRRLVRELEHLEYDALQKEERLDRVVVSKEALNCVDIVLLDRAT